MEDAGDPEPLKSADCGEGDAQPVSVGKHPALSAGWYGEEEDGRESEQEPVNSGGSPVPSEGYEEGKGSERLDCVCPVQHAVFFGLCSPNECLVSCFFDERVDIFKILSPHMIRQKASRKRSDKSERLEGER